MRNHAKNDANRIAVDKLHGLNESINPNKNAERISINALYLHGLDKKNILRRFSPDILVSQSASSGPKTLADNIRELVESGTSGELVVRSENRTGYISIQEGFLDEALVGPVSGLKALFRILSWTSPQSQFDRNDKPALYSTPLRLDAINFQKAYDRWKQRVAQSFASICIAIDSASAFVSRAENCARTFNSGCDCKTPLERPRRLVSA